MKSVVVFSCSLPLLFATAARGGTYEVPVTVDVDGVNVMATDVQLANDDSGVLELSYDLPLSLTGEPVAHIVMKMVSRDGATLVFKELSPANVATCTVAAEQMRCDTSYDTSIVHLADATSYLTSNYAQDEKLAQRLKVAASFAHEPIGILTFNSAP